MVTCHERGGVCYRVDESFLVPSGPQASDRDARRLREAPGHRGSCAHRAGDHVCAHQGAEQGARGGGAAPSQVQVPRAPEGNLLSVSWCHCVCFWCRWLHTATQWLCAQLGGAEPTRPLVSLRLTHCSPLRSISPRNTASPSSTPLSLTP